jgi:exonuclease VII large subunit
MNELERRLTEAAEAVERQYEEQKGRIASFEDELLTHLEERINGWATSLEEQSKALVALRSRQDQLEANQTALAEQLMQLVKAFDVYTSASHRR